MNFLLPEDAQQTCTTLRRGGSVKFAGLQQNGGEPDVLLFPCTAAHIDIVRGYIHDDCTLVCAGIVSLGSGCPISPTCKTALGHDGSEPERFAQSIAFINRIWGALPEFLGADDPA